MGDKILLEEFSVEPVDEAEAIVLTTVGSLRELGPNDKRVRVRIDLTGDDGPRMHRLVEGLRAVMRDQVAPTPKAQDALELPAHGARR